MNLQGIYDYFISQSVIRSITDKDFKISITCKRPNSIVREDLVQGSAHTLKALFSIGNYCCSALQVNFTCQLRAIGEKSSGCISLVCVCVCVCVCACMGVKQRERERERKRERERECVCVNLLPVSRSVCNKIELST